LTKDEIEELKNLIKSPIKDNFIAKLLIAKYFWTNNTKETFDDVVSLQPLDYDRCTLEHIIPQNPEANTNWLKDFSDNFRVDMTYKLGNMTLLTKKKNSSAKNYDFEKKRLQYRKTGLLMTREVGEQIKLTEDYFKSRQEEIVKQILSDLQIVESLQNP
jgi:hypothetical protein